MCLADFAIPEAESLIDSLTSREARRVNKDLITLTINFHSPFPLSTIRDPFSLAEAFAFDPASFNDSLASKGSSRRLQHADEEEHGKLTTSFIGDL